MSVFDNYLEGKMDNIQWNFNIAHLQDRLRMNRLTADYLKDTLLNGFPTDWEKSQDYSDRYVVFYEAPESKNYDEIKVILRCIQNEINVISVMPNNNIGTLKNQNRHCGAAYKNHKKQIQKAYSKRKRMY